MILQTFGLESKTLLGRMHLHDSFYPLPSILFLVAKNRNAFTTAGFFTDVMNALRGVHAGPTNEPEAVRTKQKGHETTVLKAAPVW